MSSEVGPKAFDFDMYEAELQNIVDNYNPIKYTHGAPYSQTASAYGKNIIALRQAFAQLNLCEKNATIIVSENPGPDVELSLQRIHAIALKHQEQIKNKT